MRSKASPRKVLSTLKVRGFRKAFEALFNFEDAGTEYGGVAQLGEHLLCKQGVRSSILLISTKWAHSSGG